MSPRRSDVGLLLILGLCVVSVSGLNAQAGAVRGAVRHADTGEPLANASVQAVGTDLLVGTDADGRYSLVEVPVGKVRLRVRTFGFGTVERTVDVEAGQVTVADFALDPEPFQLSELVVTATGQQARRELGNAVATLEAAEISERSPVTDINGLLQGRAAGVTVIQATGTLGTQGRIRIRGLSSPSLSNEPLIYVDGVRVESTSPGRSGALYIGGTAPSLLGILNPDEIESIEIVKGPSAATLYGTQATNGVIQITTKRGRAGAASIRGHVDQGIMWDVTDYPVVFFSEGRSLDGGNRLHCLPFQAAEGQCEITDLHTLDLLRQDATTPFARGHIQEYGAQASGGNDAIRYFFSGEYENSVGPIRIPETEEQFLLEERGIDEVPYDQRRPNRQERLSVRANVGAELGETTDLDVSIGYITGTLRSPQTGDNDESLLGTHLFGTADPEAASPYELVPPNQLFAHEVWRDNNRFTGSVNFTWEPAEWLRTRALAGVDYLQFDDNAKIARGQGCAVCGLDREGARTINRWTNEKYSFDLNATVTLPIDDRLRSRTAVGAQFNIDELFGSLNSANIFPPGGTTIDFGAQRSSGEETQESRTLGAYVEQQFAFEDRLFVTGALRADRNNAFGADFQTAVYPKASVSWLALEDESDGWVNTLRVRGAYGASGLQPEPNAAVQFFLPVTSTVFGGDVPAVTFGELGNQELKPERSVELEVGADAALLSNRIDVELTYYNKQTTDALVSRNLPGSLGASGARIENLGEVSNQGVEVLVHALAVDRPGLRWDVTLQASTNSNELEDLGDVPPIVGFGFQNREGYPLFGFWERGIVSFSDADGDGIIIPSEVTLSDTAVFVGPSVPTRTASLSTDVTLLDGRLRVGGLLEHQGGHKAWNVTELFRCSFVRNCRFINDPSAPLEQQAKSVGGRQAFGAWFEPGWFIKWREAYVAFDLPDRWLSAFPLSEATVTVSGRNLARWDDFESWDPELNVSGEDGAYEFAQPGLPLTVLARLDIRF